MDGKQGTKMSSGNYNGARRRWRARAARRLRDLFRPKASQISASLVDEAGPTRDEMQLNKFKSQRSTWPGRAKIVVKHTFLEFKADELEMVVRPQTRRRTKSDTHIEYGNIQEERLEPGVESRPCASWDVSRQECARGHYEHNRSDDESENSEERLCEVSHEAAVIDVSFASTADGFDRSWRWPLVLQSSQASSSSTYQAATQYPSNARQKTTHVTSSSMLAGSDNIARPKGDDNFSQSKAETSLCGSDDESENSMERSCELYAGPATNTDLFCSTVTADGFEDDKQWAGLQQDPFFVGPSTCLSGSSTQHDGSAHSAVLQSWGVSHLEKQSTIPKCREGRIAVELDKLLNEGLVRAKPQSTDEQLSQQKRSHDLNLRAAELDVHAARLKAAAAHAEAAAQQAWFEALATRQAEGSNAMASHKEMVVRHCVSASLMAQIPESFAENLVEPREQKTLQNSDDARADRRPTFNNIDRASSPSDRSNASQCSDERTALPMASDCTNTTVMLRHMPSNYTREKLLVLLDTEGFNGSYDFVYLPVDFMSFQGFGYAFVNCTSNAEAHRMFKHFQGFTSWPGPHTSTEEATSLCEVSWGNPLQGYGAHIYRYRNSPVMHKDVPEEFKPVAFVNGIRIKFPAPTKRIRPPRLKHGHPVDLSKAATKQQEKKAVVAPADAAGG
mmetsp:Transcript_86901/g.136091  ORF Transcript_86901/g.136091 Transcript_86901/m.136091 type:complete len:675 (+) Transcript_86901:31-2055(+)